MTESGYFQDPATGQVDANNAEIRHDIQAMEAPKSVFGCITAALAKRRAAGLGPFTVLSCDNLQGNGAIARAVVMHIAQAQDSELADWIATYVSFPNSMVDCIVPATGPNELAMARAFDINDAVPVTHENYRQWIIEDSFCAGRPPLEDVGAVFTKDVTPHENMKLRLLNAGHQLLANAGELLGFETVSEAMQDPHLSSFFFKVQKQEIIPHVSQADGMLGPQDYVDLVAQRFSNSAIHDTIRRIAFDGASRHSGFVHPTLREALAQKTAFEGLALSQALLSRMFAGTREDGSEIVANDPNWEQISRIAQSARKVSAIWLTQTGIYGDIAEDSAFTQSFQAWLSMLWHKGVRATLEVYMQGQSS